MSHKNLKLIIEYDGSDFLGWQIQKSGRTVQGEIESALKKIFNTNSITLVGSGRTDSGVHAKAQPAHVKLTTQMDLDKIQNAINGNIGRDIWVSKCDFVDLDFHARFDAEEREYRYFLTNLYSPINRKKEWYLPQKVDVVLLKKCAEIINGTHDFTRFCKANAEVENKVCDVFKAEWSFDDSSGKFIIQANRYLQHMVRYLVGTMVEVARGRYAVQQFESMIHNEQNDLMVFRAPAHGLFLWRISYG